MVGAKKWTKGEVRGLLDGIGNYGLSHFQKKSGQPHEYEGAPKNRSRKAIYNKIYREFGPGGLTRGVYPIHRLVQGTGYNKEQLLRAREACKQKWKRIGPGGAYLITEDQVEEIVEWLKHDYWAKQHRLYCCMHCTTEHRAHYGLGLCERCYARYRRRLVKLNLPTSNEKLFHRFESRQQSESLEFEESRKCAKFLDKLNETLRRGLALNREELQWLSTR